ncbi:hypothetical protein [Bradyrhizobium sp.]|uniref:hypothetical protein n=1 Tax=Bradyrhizobium sp. TaxID=376 RepID=UPI0039C86E8E
MIYLKRSTVDQFSFAVVQCSPRRATVQTSGFIRPPSRTCAALAATFLCVVSTPTGVAALPLTPFRYQDQAQRHCPADTVVWLDFRKRIYYSRKQRNYARGFSGSFVCRTEARSSGYRRSVLGLR